MYLFFFKFFSHLGCYIILRRVPCEHMYVPVYVYICATLHYILPILPLIVNLARIVCFLFTAAPLLVPSVSPQLLISVASAHSCMHTQDIQAVTFLHICFLFWSISYC